MTLRSCSQPPSLSDEQLFSAALGDMTADIAGHLAGCPYCQSRHQEIRALIGKLAGQTLRLGCPDPDTLAAYSANLLDADSATSIARHVDSCTACHNELALINGAAEAPQQRQALPHIAPIILTRQSATAHAQRGKSSLTTATSDHDVLYIEIVSSSGTPSLQAQVVSDTGFDWGGALATLSTDSGDASPERVHAVAMLEADGEFSFAHLPSEPFSVTITQITGRQLKLRGITAN